MEITAKMVAELRKKTNCGFMDCKKALVATNGDFDEAIKYLREQGRAVSEKKADRIAAEGIVDILKSEDGLKTAMVEVNCETDFVARNEGFKEFVRGILKTIIDKEPATLEELKALPYNGTDVTVESELVNEIATIRENITLRRFILVNGFTGTYIHGGGAAGVVAKFDTSAEIAAKPEFAEYAKNVCMQIAAMGPDYVAPSDVPASVIESEKAILLGQIENDEAMSKKPAAVKEKMVAGRVNKYYDQHCLLNQAYVKDETVTVGKYTENTGKELGGDIKVVVFVKYERGEGIEKKQEDFAAEIEKLVKG